MIGDMGGGGSVGGFAEEVRVSRLICIEGGLDPATEGKGSDATKGGGSPPDPLAPSPTDPLDEALNVSPSQRRSFEGGKEGSGGMGGGISVDSDASSSPSSSGDSAPSTDVSSSRSKSPSTSISLSISTSSGANPIKTFTKNLVSRAFPSRPTRLLVDCERWPQES